MVCPKGQVRSSVWDDCGNSWSILIFARPVMELFRLSLCICILVLLMTLKLCCLGPCRGFAARQFKGDRKGYCKGDYERLCDYVLPKWKDASIYLQASQGRRRQWSGSRGQRIAQLELKSIQQESNQPSRLQMRSRPIPVMRNSSKT